MTLKLLKEISTMKLASTGDRGLDINLEIINGVSNLVLFNRVTGRMVELKDIQDLKSFDIVTLLVKYASIPNVTSEELLLIEQISKTILQRA